MTKNVAQALMDCERPKVNTTGWTAAQLEAVSEALGLEALALLKLIEVTSARSLGHELANAETERIAVSIARRAAHYAELADAQRQRESLFGERHAVMRKASRRTH